MAPETAVVGEQGMAAPDDDGDTNAEVPIDVLERNLTSHAAHLAAAEAQWLQWLGEYCERKGWASWGCSGPVQWLSWQCGMSPSTARDKVRVSLALRDLPVMAKRLSQGRLSYSKVRALTRIATPASDAELAALGVAATGAQLDVIVRAYKKAQGADRAAKSAWSQRSWRSRVDDEESMVITLRVPAHDGDLIQTAVQNEVRTLIADELERTPGRTRQEIIDSRGGWPAMCADASFALLIGTARSDEPPVIDVDLIIDADHEAADHEPADHEPAEAGAGAASAEARPAEVLVGGRSVAPAVGHRLCCDPRVAALIEDSRGTVLGSGRRTRLVGRKLRRALHRRDNGHCQFPGCGATHRLHAHHIVHWANGGPTEPDNLILVCTFHHHVVHEGGWNIDPTTHCFIKPDGTTADAVPTERFRGSATHTTRFAAFNSTAPLAEAENERYDLGLVLESLAFRSDPALAEAEAARRRFRPLVELGPPIPTKLAHERRMQAHRARSAKLPDLYQPRSR